jgi:hypothetical protein
MAYRTKIALRLPQREGVKDLRLCNAMEFRATTLFLRN